METLVAVSLVRARCSREYLSELTAFENRWRPCPALSLEAYRSAVGKDEVRERSLR